MKPTYARLTKPEQLLDLHAAMQAAVPVTDDDKWIMAKFGGMIEQPLIWVDEDMSALVVVSAMELDPETIFDPTFMVFPGAFCYFASPLSVFGNVQVDIINWDQPNAGQLTNSSDLAGPGVFIAPFTLSDTEGWPDFPVMLGSYWPFGTEIASPSLSDIPPDDPSYDQFWGEETIHRRLFAALNLLLTQPGITATEDANISRPFIRRSKRRRQEPRVRLIRLRHSSNGHSGNGHHLTKRFIVRGHWRNQTWGPGHSLRRPTWIAPHLKGPEGAPLDTRPTVYVANATPDEVT